MIGRAEPVRQTHNDHGGIGMSSSTLYGCALFWLAADDARHATAVTRSLIDPSCRYQAGRKQIFLSMPIRQDGITNA